MVGLSVGLRPLWKSDLYKSSRVSDSDSSDSSDRSDCSDCSDCSDSSDRNDSNEKRRKKYEKKLVMKHFCDEIFFEMNKFNNEKKLWWEKCMIIFCGEEKTKLWWKKIGIKKYNEEKNWDDKIVMKKTLWQLFVW